MFGALQCRLDKHVMEILLFSGGIESTCLAFMRRPDICLTIDYGQIVAGSEISAAKNIAEHLELRHEVLTAPLPNLGSGQLAGSAPIAQATIPEFWPYRNQLLITLAAMKFAGEDELIISIGTAKGDASHRDGTPEFIEKMNSLLVMQEGNAKLIAPAATTDSIDLLLASSIDVDVLDMTFSCFLADYPCGRCRGCSKNEHLRSAYFDHRPSCHSVSDTDES
jgi:7-cyano-7-deazaguanine synthase